MLMYNNNIYDKLIERKRNTDDVNSLLDFQAEILCENLKEIMSLGLLNRMNPHIVQTGRPRGQVDIQRSANSGAIGKFELECKISKKDLNNPCNQIIKAAVTRLIVLNKHYGGNEIQKERLRQLRYFRDILREVRDIDNSKEIRLESQLQIPTEYRTAYQIQLVILKNFIIQGSREGKHNLYDLEDYQKIHLLYQNFIQNFYKKKLSRGQIVVTSQEHIRWESDLDSSIYKNLAPDCLICDTVNKRLLLIDVKWYDQQSEKTADDRKVGINNSELGKSFLYAVAFKNSEKYRDYAVHSIVLMAKNIENDSDTQWIFYKGNKTSWVDIEFQVVHHSMNKSLDDIEKDLLEIADKGLYGDFQKI